MSNSSPGVVPDASLRLGALNLIVDHAKKLPAGHVLVLDFLPPEVERMFKEVPESLPTGLAIGRSRAS
ncbi:hypothetical protein [Actinomadura sp. 6N118]|uniref:hypothetical protein n=1 Tax=Actinomadura sp. 6N118 TaxID=3375151 RepID=UPI00378A55F4